MGHRSWFRRSVCAAALVLAAAAAARAGEPAATEPTVERHVALSVELLEASVAEWQERVALATAEMDAAERDKARAALEAKYKAVRGRLYEQYQTNSPAHLAFAGAHRAEIDAYLDDAPEIKARIDSLTQALRSLVGQHEASGRAQQGAGQ